MLLKSKYKLNFTVKFKTLKKVRFSLKKLKICCSCHFKLDYGSKVSSDSLSIESPENFTPFRPSRWSKMRTFEGNSTVCGKKRWETLEIESAKRVQLFSISENFLSQFLIWEEIFLWAKSFSLKFDGCRKI